MLKRKSNLLKVTLLSSLAGILVLSFWISSCKKTETVDVPTNNPNGAATVNQLSAILDTASLTVDLYDTSTYTWKLDKVHSNIMWETYYFGANALLTGRFNNFWMKVKFDEANLSATKFDGWVQLSTFNTGEAGRDAYGKCGPTYMGIVNDTAAKKGYAETDTAWFTSTGAERYGNGYVSHGFLTFNRDTTGTGKVPAPITAPKIKKPVDFYFTYSPVQMPANAATKTLRSGFQGSFTFNCRDFQETSTSIADMVTIRVDANLTKKWQ